jgi:hypothetical protein
MPWVPVRPRLDVIYIPPGVTVVLVAILVFSADVPLGLGSASRDIFGIVQVRGCIASGKRRDRSVGGVTDCVAKWVSDLLGGELLAVGRDGGGGDE